MKITIDFHDVDGGFGRRAIFHMSNENKKLREATDEEVQEFAQAAFDEWLASAEAEYPQLLEDAYLKKLAKRGQQ